MDKNEVPNYFDAALVQLESPQQLQPNPYSQPAYQPPLYNNPYANPYQQPNAQVPTSQNSYNPQVNPYVHPSAHPYNQPSNQPSLPPPQMPMGYPPVYGQNAPVFVGQPPPPAHYQVAPPQANPLTYVVKVEGYKRASCPFCHKSASNFSKKRAGCAVWGWSICLLFFTSCLCCWIPCVMSDCYDQEVVCSNCLAVRAYIPSKYGCWIYSTLMIYISLITFYESTMRICFRPHHFIIPANCLSALTVEIIYASTLIPHFLSSSHFFRRMNIP